MIAIKGMEMPESCHKCDYMGGECQWRGQAEGRHSDCPLIDIQPLTDQEQRIFLSAMSREEVVCKQIDIDKVDDGSTLKLVPICKSIERKVKKVLWR